MLPTHGCPRLSRRSVETLPRPSVLYPALDRGDCCLLLLAVVGGSVRRHDTRRGSMSWRQTRGAFEDDGEQREREREKERERFSSVIHARMQTPRRILESFSYCAFLSFSLAPSLSLSFFLARIHFRARARLFTLLPFFLLRFFESRSDDCYRAFKIVRVLISALASERI